MYHFFLLHPTHAAFANSLNTNWGSTEIVGKKSLDNMHKVGVKNKRHHPFAFITIDNG